MVYSSCSQWKCSSEVIHLVQIPTEVIKMENIWEGTDYDVCPSCKQIVIKDELIKHRHFCLDDFYPIHGSWD